MPVLESSRIVAALRGAFAREAGREELLRIAAEKIRGAGPPYTSVYLYMLHENELVLEAFAGRETDHTRIPVQIGLLHVLDPSTQRLDQLIGPQDGPAAGAGLRLGRMLDQAGEGDQRTRAHRLFDGGGNAHFTEVALQRFVHGEPGLEASHEFRRLLLIGVGQGLDRFREDELD